MMGKQVKDKISGFTGIVTARCEYINGCVQFCVVPNIGTDGKYPDGQYIDQQRLEVIGEGVALPAAQDTGGDMADTPSADMRA